ncbi:cell division protein FtsL [Halioxenophilus sp. WMMB6]|uniref:cell division protein FtsL n=1 Tax=Halioxenophilus sp. WMMB6 TaxID=3073815 RepID=UPI00295EAC36|nr:cell division protein FtsL [Halioxenophilus sp. WMMB6]
MVTRTALDYSDSAPTTGWPSRLLVAVLWVLVLASAVAVIYTSHQSRQLTAELAVAQSESAALQEQWGQYLLERSAWGAYSRVENLAVEKLQMAPPPAESIVVVER